MNQTQHTLHPALIRLLESRGIKGQAVSDFLSWDLKDLPDLTQMLDLEKACDHIIAAIDAGEKIGIYGDYDVDGTTSCALFWHFFQMIGVEVELIQPSRFIEGYGLHASSIDQAQEMGIKLLITVDCGISNCEAADYAKEKGLGLIITDHHKDAREHMPAALAVVNPNRRDEPEDSPLRAMAGVGVAFAICVGIRQKLIERGQKVESLYPLLQFVAIGTICDMAKLNHINLRLTRHGLKQMPTTTYPGIRIFLSPEERKFAVIPSDKCSFFIGPMINSKGRLDHPEKALKLLIAKDSEEAFEHYSHLEISNKERKFIQSQVYKEARDQVLATMDENHLISIVYSPEWHEGVIGIVASKLVENFRAPAIVFTNAEQEGVIKASARSAGDLSIFDSLKKVEDLFLKFGGHKAAAGLSMPKENYPEFCKRIKADLAQVPANLRTNAPSFDIDLGPSEITPKLVKELEALEPFGMGNARPVFRVKGLDLQSFDTLKDVHIRWNFKYQDQEKPLNLKGISFNYVGKYETLSPQEVYQANAFKQEPLSVICGVGINRFNGNEYLQLQVDRVDLGNV